MLVVVMSVGCSIGKNDDDKSTWWRKNQCKGLPKEAVLAVGHVFGVHNRRSLSLEVMLVGRRIGIRARSGVIRRCH